VITLLDLPRQYRNIRPEIDAALQSVLDNGRYVGAPVVEAFEREFAAYVGVGHCVGVGSGTDALRIALEAAGIGGEVIVPANSAFPTAEAVVQAGARPVFCDCRPGSYIMSPDHFRSLIGPDETEAVIPVHLYGNACDMDTIMGIAARHGLFVLEDCAHAHGALYHGRPVGSLGHAAAFSFNPVKVLGAVGDAGGITTDDEGLALRCRSLRDHGRREKYVHGRIGHNSRLDAVNAAVLSVKLKYLDRWVDHRNRVASWYTERLRDVVVLPGVADRAWHAYHQFVVRVPERDRVRQALATVYDIETGIHYPLVLSQQPALRYLNAKPEDTPTATAYAQEILSLPMNESIREPEVAAVCEALEMICQ